MFEQISDSNTLYIIAGPCAAESEEQLRCTCESLMTRQPLQAEAQGNATACVQLLRCGVWKPRTRPGGFEGMDEQALQWMSQLKRQHPSWRFATEVATPQHVELALKYGIDALWTGARTTGNPFLVAELCEALRGAAVSMMIKNPISPDLNLWIGAIERVQRAGITDIAAVHRGFQGLSSRHKVLRNDPLWEVPIELRRAMPALPLFCDPSHLGGSKEYIATLSQTALNLDFDGLMVECHISPEQALTDARQQLTPAELHQLLADLALPRRKAQTDATPRELTVLREGLDLIDGELLHLVRQRLTLSQEIAEVKARYGMTTYQPKQWGYKLNHILELSRRMGLDETLAKDLFERLHMASIREQEAWKSKREK